MKQLIYLFSLLAVFIASNVRAQDIMSDKDAEPLFSMPKTDLTVKVSSKNIGFTFPIPTGVLKTTQYYICDKRDSMIYTMKKSIRLTGAINLLENTKNTVLFTKNTNVTPMFEIALNSLIDEFQNPDAKWGTYFTFGAAASIRYQNFKVYDQVAHANINEYKGWNPGARVQANIFHGTLYAIALNASWQHSVVVSDLSPYQKSPAVLFSDVNVVSNGTTIGYFSPVEAKMVKRVSVAIPFFAFNRFLRKVNSQGNERGYDIVPAPYYYANITDKTAHNFGLGASIIPARFYRAKKPKLDAAFSINYNFINSGDKENARSLYVAGSFNLGVIFPKLNGSPKEQ